MNNFKNIINNLRQKPYIGLYVAFGLVFMVLILSILLFPSPDNSTGAQPEVTLSPTSAPATTVTPLSEEDQIKRQAIMDENTLKKEREIFSTYPWYDKLPLRAADYFVYFDLEKKIFVGLLYPANTSQNEIVSQTVTMKAEIRKSLTDLGIDVEKYEFEWVIKPEDK